MNDNIENYYKKMNIELRAIKTRCAELERKVTSLKNIITQSKEHLTLDEAAVFLGCTKSLLYKMTHLHTIPFYKPSNKMVYFEKSELIRWIKQNKSFSDDEISEQADSILATLSTK